MITITNNIETNRVVLGAVWASPLTVSNIPAGFEAALSDLIKKRTKELEERRLKVRDMLRQGRYKPTGRGKPASEYLLRSAQAPDRTFPRINAPVDICNFISLQTLLPVSLWDLRRAGSDRYEFRLGRPEEHYVFNTGGQHIALQDLVVGCMVNETAGSSPIVNPVKDSLATKTTPETTAVGACLYAPIDVVPDEKLRNVTRTFANWLAGCGTGVETGHAVIHPGETKTL